MNSIQLCHIVESYRSGTFGPAKRMLVLTDYPELLVRLIETTWPVLNRKSVSALSDEEASSAHAFTPLAFDLTGAAPLDAREVITTVSLSMLQRALFIARPSQYQAISEFPFDFIVREEPL